MEFFRLLELFRCNLLDLSFSFFSSKATFGNKTNPFYEISYYVLTKAFINTVIKIHNNKGQILMISKGYFLMDLFILII